MTRVVLFSAVCLTALAVAAEYTGPHPPKPDIPYLQQADRLIEPETKQSQQDNRKGGITYTVDGATSPARTPLAEPIFIIDARQLSAERFELYRFETRNGHRELTLGKSKRRGGNGPFHLQVTPLGGHLYRVEADEHLDNGEYALSPSDSNTVYCFTVY